MTCPFCEQNRVTPHSKSARTPRRRYLCLSCRRTFTDLTGTPFARTHLPMSTWFLCLRLRGEKRRTVELARELGIKWDAAAHVQRRLAKALGRPGLVQRLRQVANQAWDEQGRPRSGTMLTR